MAKLASSAKRRGARSLRPLEARTQRIIDSVKRLSLRVRSLELARDLDPDQVKTDDTSADSD